MNNSAVLVALESILCRIKEGEVELDYDTDIINEVGLDSLQTIMLILELEDTFEIEVDVEEFDYELLLNTKSLIGFIKENIK